MLTNNCDKYNKVEIDSESIDEIYKFCDDYDFIIVNTYINITKLKKEFASILLDNNGGNRKYFCSKKYFVIKDKIFEFTKYYRTNYYNSFILFNDDVIYKYVEKLKNPIQNAEDIINVYKLLNDPNLTNYDFIKEQKVLFFDDNKYYSSILCKRINGEMLNLNIINKLTFSQKYNLLFSILKQTVCLEKNGYIYYDLYFKNIIYNKYNNQPYLVDLGSYHTDKKLFLKYFSYFNFNLLERIITFIYNIFNIKQNLFINNLNYTKTYNINNYDSKIRNVMKKFFIFLEQKQNKVMYIDIYNFFKNTKFENNTKFIKNIFINKN